MERVCLHVEPFHRGKYEDEVSRDESFSMQVYQRQVDKDWGWIIMSVGSLRRVRLFCFSVGPTSDRNNGGAPSMISIVACFGDRSTSRMLPRHSIETGCSLNRPFVFVLTLAGDDAALAYKDAVDRFLGKKVDLRFVEPKPVGLVRKNLLLPAAVMLLLLSR